MQSVGSSPGPDRPAADAAETEPLQLRRDMPADVLVCFELLEPFDEVEGAIRVLILFESHNRKPEV